MISTHWRIIHQPSERDLRLLDILARQAAALIERKRTEEALRESERIQRMLARVGELAARTSHTGELIEAIGKSVANEFGVSRCGFSRVDTANGTVTVLQDYHGELASLAGVYLIERYAKHWIENGLAGRTVAFDDLAADADTAGYYQKVFAPLRVRAHVTVPLHRDGAWVANFWASHHEPYHWAPAQIALMDLIAERVWAIIENKRAEEERAVRERELREYKRLLDLSLDGIVVCDPMHRIQNWNKGAERLYGYSSEEARGVIMSELLASVYPEPFDCIETALLTDGHWSGEVSSTRADGKRVTTESRWVLDRDDRGAPRAILKTHTDITARKEAESTRKLLIDELNHRAKNMLATVQAIATQSLRRTKTPAGFVTGFTGRIQALAKAHTLLTLGEWREADLMTLVHDQLLIDSDATDPRITCSGPTVALAPQMALQLSLALHELGTNARKYGALSVPDGKLAVTWSVHSDRTRELHLQWVETNGKKPKISPSRQPGFGTTLIQSIAAEGRAEMRIGAGGIEWDIRLPLPEDTPDRRLPPTPRQRNAQASSVTSAAFAGAHVLILEDEPLIALELAGIVESYDVDVIGPAHSLGRAQELIKSQRVDAALLDVNVAGERVDELAAALTRNSVPFAFLTGYGRETLPVAFQRAPLVPKPIRVQQILEVLGTLLQSKTETGSQLRSKGQ
jgi:PAS domain S-box-containing protein